ncbi:MAG: alpha/beta hydrolase [Mycobacterium sp.]
MNLRHIDRDKLVAAAGGDPWQVNATLQHGRPAHIAGLAQAFHDAGKSTREADDAFQQARERFEKSWNRENGEHPINDSAEVQLATQSLGVQAAQLPKIGADLETIAAALAEAQRSSGGYISSLEKQLQVIDNELDAAIEAEKNPHLTDVERSILSKHIHGLEQQAVDDTQATLQQVKHVRDGYTGTLQTAEANLRADGYDPALVHGVDAPESPAKPDGPGIPIPLPNTSAEDVNKWWNSLSPEQRTQLIAQHPPELGNLNGIPVIARDEVNEAVMNDDLSRVQDLANQYGVSAGDVVGNPAKYGLSATAITRYNNAVQTQKGLSVDSDDGKNPVFLHTYDPEAFDGRGREAIAIGNPDTAANTTVLVPGTGSSVRDGYLSHRDGLELYKEAQRAGLGKATAVEVWMGYHAPDSLTDPQVGQPTLARNGGGLLATDVNALGVTHQGASHVTVIGHSYGSTTVADAAAGSGMHANDVVLVGPPGTDLAHSAADFHLQGGHVYVGAASSDPITHLGGVEEHVPGTGVTIGLGNDPAVEGYGSTRFKAEVPGVTWPWKDHSSYFARGSESLFSIGDIASGHGDALAHDQMTAPHRGSYWLPDDVDPEVFRPGTGGHAH